jgi:hypothetical protein
MKKISLLILVIFITTLSACSGGTKDLELAKEVYQELNDIYAIVDVYASDTYSAWHYGIYGKPHSRTGLASKVSLSSDQFLGITCLLLSANEFSYTVGCVQQTHEALGNYESVRERLNGVRVSINTLRDSKNDDVKNLARDLQLYYTTLINLLNLAEDYSGSFNALTTDIRDYRNQVNGFKNSLEFDLGK